MHEQALLDAGARLVGKTQMDELVRSFTNCSFFLQRLCWRWLRPYMLSAMRSWHRLHWLDLLQVKCRFTTLVVMLSWKHTCS